MIPSFEYIKSEDSKPKKKSSETESTPKVEQTPENNYGVFLNLMAHFGGTKLEAMAAVPENIQGTYVYGNGVTISADEISAPLNWGDVVTLPLAKEDALNEFKEYFPENEVEYFISY